MKRLTLLVVLASALQLAAQTASVVPYGSGCGPVLSWTGLPRLGQQLTLIYSGPNSYFESHGVAYIDRPVLLLGVSDQRIGTTPLPLLLPTSITNGVPGCLVLQSTDLAILMPYQAPFPPTKFESQAVLTIPNDAGLLGLPFFAQWMNWHRERQAIFLPWIDWIHLSAAIRATVGV